MRAQPGKQKAVETGEEIASVVERGTRTLKRVLPRVGRDNIRMLHVAVNEVDFLVKAAQVAAETAVQLDPTEVKLHQARLRGLKRIVELRKAAEPVMETGEVCELLGVTRETIRKKVDRRQMIALPKGGDRVFPAFQFKEGAILKGLPEVLGALDTESVFTILSFLLSSNPDFDNRTALELLQTGELEPVLTEARTFLKHGV